MKKIYWLLFLIVLWGCQTTVKTVYGIKKPRLEDSRSIKNYLLKHDVDTAHVVTFKDIMSFAKASEQNLLAIPEATFFNKDGFLVRYKKETVDCNASVGDFISDLKGFASLEPDSTVKFNDVASLLSTHQQLKPSAEINVFITWTVYAGRLNKEKAFDWVKLLEQAKSEGVSVNYHLLNCDYQKSWNIPQPLQDKLGIKN